jgi:antitoxin (DNA-binding transcriptional repressor) of toxin-antitoxin stability system
MDAARAAPATTNELSTASRRGANRRLAPMTIDDYDMVMNDVRIADLKSRLSEHLRKVRAGRTLRVLDRDTPIARIVPWVEAGAGLQVRKPLPGAPELRRVSLPPPLRTKTDIVELLLDERQGEQ